MKNKKGFTLIEIIVVVVILAVLMAVVTPAILGYINEADDAKYYAQGRALLTAAQHQIILEKKDGISNASIKQDIVSEAQLDGTLDEFNYDYDVNYFLYDIEGTSKKLEYSQTDGKFKIIEGEEVVEGSFEDITGLTGSERNEAIKTNKILMIAKITPLVETFIKEKNSNAMYTQKEQLNIKVAGSNTEISEAYDQNFNKIELGGTYNLSTVIENELFKDTQLKELIGNDTINIYFKEMRYNNKKYYAMEIASISGANKLFG